ncbi:PP2C family protein-serine/threonine phosphatase [Streptomyces sclerotialus]|uniref:PP2C family protein-serine/threonine phosphatase n=1 Tax=Streptomyces sclerotialus TaxID=1957 RepID=UPI0004C6A484
MTAPHAPKVAGIEPTLPGPAHTAAPTTPGAPSTAHPAAALDRLTAWLSDLTTLHDLTERLARTSSLDAALDEVLRAGALLVGARRGLVTLEPPDGLGPDTTTGLGLGPADLGHLETVPRRLTPVGRILDGAPPQVADAAPHAATGPSTASTAAAASAASTASAASAAPHELPLELSQPDIAAEPGLDPRLRTVAARLGYAASYAVPLIAVPPAAEPLTTGLPAMESAVAEPVASEAPDTGGTSRGGPDGVTGGGTRPGPGSEPGAGTGPGTGSTPSAPGTPSTPSTGSTEAGEETGEGGHGGGREGAAATRPVRPLGVAVWLYDEPAEPTARGRRLLGMYRAYATAHLSRLIELDRRRRSEQTLRAELLPARLPQVPGVRLAVRHAAGPYGGGDWYDALPLPDGALSLSVGSVTGSGPSAVAAMGRLRAALRAYAVMEGEDPVAVLSDLELLLRLTEPARSATALFAFAEPPVADPLGEPRAHKLLLAGAGHCPPLLVGEHRTEFVETSLSAPLGMLSCWEAPSVDLEPLPGETLLLYSDGLLHRTGEPVDRAFARLHTAASGLPRSVREDPEALVDHLVSAMLPQGGLADESSPEDVVLLAARFEP